MKGLGYSLVEKIKLFAVVSRIMILCLQFVFNVLIPDHDAGVFKKPFNENSTTVLLGDRFTRVLLGGLSNWDGQYFLHIAEYGYTYENTLAFFPFFPLLVRYVTFIIRSVIGNLFSFFLPYGEIISIHYALLLTGIVLNNLLFVKSAVILYKLSMVVLGNEKLSYAACILFCVNPASIFFSAFYTESLYCFLIFYALYQIEMKKFFVSSLVIGLSALTRSNGIINIGFICYAYIKLKINKKLSCIHDFIFSICLFLSALPFTFYQLYCYFKFCLSGNHSMPEFIQLYGRKNNFVFPGENSSWCYQNIPFAYSYVQSHYWNVGFLRYYEPKQIPNFVLAFPIFLLIFSGCYLYAKQNGSSIFTLGLVSAPNRGTHIFSLNSFVYVTHCLALSLFAMLVVHIQVSTRLLFSSSPVPYWFSAWLVSGAVGNSPKDIATKKFPKAKQSEWTFERKENKNSAWKTFLLTDSLHGSGYLIKCYYLCYSLVGTFMFSNHLPWT